MRSDFPIVGSYDNQRQTVISAERTVNLFEYIDPNGKRKNSLIPSAGLVDTEISFLPETGGARAAFVYKNVLYQVFGASVYRITSSGGNLSFSKIGSLSTASGHVGIDANTFQVFFVDGVSGWIWDINATTFEQITDTGFPSMPVDCCALDGFFVVAHGGTNQFQLSSLEQGMVWSGNGVATFTTDTTTDIFTLSTTTANFATGTPVTFSTTGALPTTVPAINSSDTFYVIRVDGVTVPTGGIRIATSYANAIAGTYVDVTVNGAPTNTVTVTGQLQLGTITSHPGNIVGCRTLHRRLFLFSDFFTEVWENAGAGTNLPFRRNNSLLMEVGTPAVSSISVGFDRMFFLSQTRDGIDSVMEVRGTEAIPVSNRALEYQIAQYAANPLQGVSDAQGILAREDGLIFYRLNFTAADHTFVLGVSMSTQGDPKWHEEEVLDGSRHPAQTHGFLGGVNYYGSYSEARLYYSDSTVSNNDGEAIRRMRIARTLAPEGYYRTRIDRFHLDLLQGNVPLVTFDEQNLDAENSDDILAEDGQMILLEQQVTERSGQPPVFLSYSKDGGQSYGYIQQGSMGKLGQRTYRTVWRKLGTIPRGQGFTVKIEFYSDVPFVVLGASWNFEIMPE